MLMKNLNVRTFPDLLKQFQEEVLIHHPRFNKMNYHHLKVCLETPFQHYVKLLSENDIRVLQIRHVVTLNPRFNRIVGLIRRERELGISTPEKEEKLINVLKYIVENEGRTDRREWFRKKLQAFLAE